MRIIVSMALAALLAAPAAAQEARSFTLEEAVRVALAQSTDVARAENRAAAAELSVAEARARYLPDLSLSASNQQSLDRSLEAGGALPGATSANTTSLRVSSGLTLYDGGARASVLEAARMGARAQALDTERTRQTVVFQVVTGFLSLTETEEQLKVAEENAAAQEQRERLVSALVDGGTRPIAELYQQQAAVAAARATVVDARRAVELARMELVRVMRLDPLGEYSFQAPSLDRAPAAAPDTEALIGRALASRPDLRALGMDAGAAEQGVRAAQAARLPAVSVSAGYGTTASTAGQSGWIDQLDGRQGGSVSVGLSIPLYDRGSASRGVERARVEADNARLAVEDARQLVAVEVRRAVLDRTSALAAVEAAEARVAAAEQALAATERRYQAGASTLFEVTQTRADLVDAASARVRARYTLHYRDAVLDYYTGELEARAAP